MRIRQVKPAFWTDPETGRWPSDAQTLYIRLWAIADDVGWLEWDPDLIGALTYPYQAAARRVRHIERYAAILIETGRLVLHDCGCGFLPKLEAHQRVAGKKTIHAFQRHLRHPVATNGYPVLTDSLFPVTVAPVSGKGKEVSGTAAGGLKIVKGEYVHDAS